MAADSSLRVVILGSSPVGLSLQAAIGAAPDMELVAGAFGTYDTAEMESIEADVAIIADGPKLTRIAPTLRHFMLRKVPVVCDSGEMLWPWLRNPHLADVLANEAQRAGVAIVGIGNDPVAVDLLLPALRASPNATRVVIRRHIDLSQDKGPLHRQVGVPRTAEQFRKLAIDGVVGLSGLGELVTLIAQALGRHPLRGDIRTALRPTLGSNSKVAGLRQTAALTGDGLEIEVHYIVEDGASPADDLAEITAGETTTFPLPQNDLTAALVAAARTLPTLPAGLRTPLDGVAAA